MKRGKTTWWLIYAICLGILTGCGSGINNLQSVDSAALSAFKSTPVAENYFGMHIHHATTGTPWPSVPLGTWRLWDANVTWMDIEPARGKWDFTKLDALVALAQQHHVDIILPLALTPQWASARPSEPCAYTLGCAAEPTAIQDWSDYVQAVTQRYKGKIAYYEIWNEVNFSATWSGTPAQIIGLQNAAFPIIKANDPSAQVISANVCDDLNYLQELFGLGLAESADIIGYHFYVSEPESIAGVATSINAMLTKLGVSKPVWNTESGWLPPSEFPSDQLAAATVVRALIVAKSSGIQRFMWYSWDNHTAVTLYLTLPDDITLTPAALAYANLQKWLLGNTLSPCSQGSMGVWSCDLQFVDGRKGIIMWSPAGTVTVDLGINWVPNVSEDMYGNSSAPSKGKLTLGVAPILLRQ